MATEPNTSNNKKTEENSDSYLGQPIDRRGKTLTDEQAAIFERYNQWKNNLMCLYNHIESYALPYPARTVQFLPNPKENISSANQYQRYTNCPFVYPSHCSVPRQNQSINSTQTNTDSMKKSSKSNGSMDNHTQQRLRKTPIYYLQSMNYFVSNRIQEQQHLYDLFNNGNNTNIDFSNLSGIEESSSITGILPYDEYYSGGPCVESAYDVYRLRIMPQQPHLIATRSYHEDIAIYWLDYNYLANPLNAFNKHNKRRKKHRNNTMPERSGLTASDDEDDDDHDIDIDIDIDMKDNNNNNNNNNNIRKRKRLRIRNNNESDYPTKKQKLEHKDTYDHDHDHDSPDEEYESDHDNQMNISVGDTYGYLVAVGQTSSKTKTGWGLAFNPQHSGMFITGNSDGSIACWDLNMIDNSHCMTKMGKFKNKKSSVDPNVYMRDSKIRGTKFNSGPPFITHDRCEEYHWFEEFEKYGIWNACNNTTNPDIMSLDWCHDSAHIFISSANNGQISIWDRRAKQVKKKPQLWTWGTSHNQSILSVSWNPIQHSLIASGDKANKVRIWDIRKFNRHTVQLAQHGAAVYHVKWCPYNKYLLASSSSDKMLLMYDLRRCGLSNDINNNNNNVNNIKLEDGNSNVPKQAKGVGDGGGGVESISKLLEDLDENSIGNYYNTTCPELVFAHYGHTACIPEFDWCPSNDLTMISTDMDGIVHTWQPPNGMLNTFQWVLDSHGDVSHDISTNTNNNNNSNNTNDL